MSDPSASMHERLRRATAAQHRRLDHGLRYVLGEELTLERYGRLLAALYGFQVPLEASLGALQSGAAALGVPLVRRTELLERDLRTLGTEPARLPICSPLPPLERVDHLAGAFYVAEGASLGGQVISRAVTRRLGLRREHGAAFFSGEGARTAERWQAVLAWLEARGNRAAWAGDDIAEGACRTFGALSRWLAAQRVLDD